MGKLDKLLIKIIGNGANSPYNGVKMRNEKPILNRFCCNGFAITNKTFYIEHSL